MGRRGEGENDTVNEDVVEETPWRDCKDEDRLDE